MKRFAFLFLLLVFVTKAFPSSKEEKPLVKIARTTDPITIDGNLIETSWMKADVATNFIQNFPFDTAYSTSKTEVRLAFDDHFLYISAVCFDEWPDKKYVIQSLKRDFSYPVNDAFVVFIDPFNDKTNGFSFGVNPMGSQREGVLENGGGFGVTTAWDNKWFSHVERHADRWVVEMAIPFKTLRYKEGINEWGINFARNNLKINESSTWAKVPTNFNVAQLSHTGSLVWEELPQKAGMNVSIIPYAIGGASADYQKKTSGITGNAGVDAKVAVSSSLNLDLTVNPDFSQVEVDRQQVNLTRFSLFFPEQRLFFVENSDLFSRFGFSKIRPFYSRNIGLYYDTSKSSYQKIPILAGARLSGKINKNWRVGLMNMQTAQQDDIGAISQNYTVGAVQRQVFKRSNIAAIFVNRQGMPSYDYDRTNYNRIVGLDYNIASANNVIQGKLFHHQAIFPGATYASSANASWLMYSTKRVFVMWNHEYVNKDYRAEVGFVPRNKQYNPILGRNVELTYWRLEPYIGINFYPKKIGINRLTPGLYYDAYYKHDFTPTDWLIRPSLEFVLSNTSSLSMNVEHIYTKLLYDTDVSFSHKEDVIPSGDYTYTAAKVDYKTDIRRKLNGLASATYGTYFAGTKLSCGVEAYYRIQPFVNFALTYSLDQIGLPNRAEKVNINLIGSKIEVTASNNLFFTLFTQYNSQINIINLNARLQWRFRPMSDLFIVYTDIYDPYLITDDYVYIRNKSRAVVLKFVYWFTV